MSWSGIYRSRSLLVSNLYNIFITPQAPKSGNLKETKILYYLGKKLAEFSAEEEEVLLLLERVMEAKRISVMKMKESGGKKRRRGGDADDNDDDIDQYLGPKKGKFSKKSKKN